MSTDNIDVTTVGWREWLVLPELGITGIKAKLDTGARTSALHTHTLKIDTRNGVPSAHFSVHPLHKSDRLVDCHAPLIDQRWVTDSGGHRELRPVIRTMVQLGTELWSVEVTLTQRNNMRFHMLLGRTAMNGRLRIDPGQSYVLGRKPPNSAIEANV